MGSVPVAINDADVWAYVVETDEGLRGWFALDDWQRRNRGQGERIPVRLLGKADVWLFITSATEQPPVLWVMLAHRIGAAG